MKIGIVGSRSRDTVKDFDLVLTKFKELYKVGDIIISGGCSRGGDRFAEVIANQLHVEIIIFPANWQRYGKAAGFIRNTDIARESDILIACVASNRLGGTEDTVNKYLKLGKSHLYLV